MILESIRILVDPCSQIILQKSSTVKSVGPETKCTIISGEIAIHSVFTFWLVQGIAYIGHNYTV